MSTTKNLWGELPLAEVVRTPTAILREQASQLTELTGGLLEGSIYKGKSMAPARKGKPFLTRLSIVVPALDSYSYVIMRVYHDVMLYPVAVVDQVNSEEYECHNEKTFVEVVERILTSPAVHKAIAALLSQSESEGTL